MQKSLVSMTLSPLGAAIFLFCCISVSCLGQVFDQQHKLNEVRPFHINSQDEQKASYALEHEHFSPLQQHSLADFSHETLSLHNPSNNANHQSTKIEAHKLDVNTNGNYHRRPEFKQWFVNSGPDYAAALKIYEGNHIISPLLKRASRWPSPYSDFVRNDGSSFHDSNFAANPYFPKVPSETPETIFTNQNVNYYDDLDDSFYENGFDDSNDVQTYDNIYDDNKYPAHTKRAIWQDKSSHIRDTQLPGLQTKLKFNDSFHKYFTQSRTSGIHKRFLDSIAGEIIKKNHQNDIDQIFSEQNNQNEDIGYSGSFMHNDLEFSGGNNYKENSEIIHTKGIQANERQETNGVGSISYGQRARKYHAVPPNKDDNSDGHFQEQTDFTEHRNLLQGEALSKTDLEKDLDQVSKVSFHGSGKNFDSSNGQEKRYLDGIASSLIKKDDGEKRYLDGIASSLIKKDDGEKRYLDGIASSLIKKDDGEKRYLDGIASSLIKKDDGEKRYLDGIASSLIKKDDGEKRYLDGIASSLIKKDDGEKRYLDGIASSLIKKDDGEKRYLDGIASSLIKKDDGEKRYLDGIASSLIKKDDGEKRYLDGIASSLIKKDDGEKRYLDGIASSLIKKDDGEKRYLDGIASSLIKKDDGEKRYLDGIASSLIKKDDGEKRYLDGIASSLIKKDDGEKRYLDGIASSLIKKDDGEKRYLDGIASSLIKKDDGEKRYLDGIASSLIKKDDAEKRYLDGIASSLIKKNDGEKRYLDGIASSLIKKDDGKKRYFDGIASSLIKKDDGDKRYLDGIASSLIKKDDGEKRYLDGIASSLIKKNDGEKRYLDGIASSLIKKEVGEKRYLDGISSSLIKRENGEKRYLDGVASSLIKKDDVEKRYLDGIASSLIKKDDGEKRYLDGIASSLIKRDDGEKRFLDGIASSLIKKRTDISRHFEGQKAHTDTAQAGNHPGVADPSGPSKRTFEVTDDVMDGSRDTKTVTKAPAGTSGSVAATAPEKYQLLNGSSSRRRRDTKVLVLPQERTQVRLLQSHHRQKRFVDGIANTILYKRPGLYPNSLKYKAELATSADNWDRPQILLTSVNAADPRWTVLYQPRNLQNESRDITSQFLGQSHVIGERFHTGGQDNDVYNSDLDILDKETPNRREQKTYAGDYFDEIAGDLLT